jgi:hypothetical protein
MRGADLDEAKSAPQRGASEEQMASRKKMWVYAPSRRSKPAVPEAVKAQVQKRADELVASFFRPDFVKPAPEDERFNFISDITTRWRTAFFTFTAVFTCPSPEALAPTFEAPFARLEYTGPDRFSLAYMRHTEKWWELYRDLSLDEAFAILREQGHFHPPG